MSKPKRVQRPKEELKRELVEQLALLRHSCTAFDNGFEAVGKHIALSLRVLLHDHRQSRSLLDQLGLRNGRYLTSAPPLNPRNLLTECNLVGMQLSTGGSRYLPLIAMGDGPHPLQQGFRTRLAYRPISPACAPAPRHPTPPPCA